MYLKFFKVLFILLLPNLSFSNINIDLELECLDFFTEFDRVGLSPRTYDPELKVAIIPKREGKKLRFYVFSKENIKKYTVKKNMYFKEAYTQKRKDFFKLDVALENKGSMILGLYNSPQKAMVKKLDPVKGERYKKIKGVDSVTDESRKILQGEIVNAINDISMNPIAYGLIKNKINKDNSGTIYSRYAGMFRKCSQNSMKDVKGIRSALDSLADKIFSNSEAENNIDKASVKAGL